MRTAVACLAIAIFSLSGIALAQPAGKGANPCRADAEKFCKDVKPGGGRIVQCLEQHVPELSGPCRASFEEAQKKHPCHADTQRLCKGVQPGEGRIAECMKRNESQLSAACKARLEQERARRPQGKQ
jgi:hypothetical protein